MNNFSILKRLADFICELTDFYRELSEELPQLRIVAHDSEPKKTVLYLNFRCNQLGKSKLLCQI